jgi:TolB protein
MTSASSLGSTRRLALVLAAAAVLALASAVVAAGAASASERGGLVAFARSDGIYTMRADGSGVRRLRALPAAPSDLAWSPDGRRLAFVTPAHGNLLWLLNADGSGLSRIVLHTGEAKSPTWSPDGRKIAFTGWLDHGRDIWIMNSDGSGQHRLARTHGYQEAAIAWSPDGRQLAFSGLLYQGIHLINLTGTIVRHLPAQMFGYYSWEGEPSWSPDGSRILFMQKTKTASHGWPNSTWPGPTSIALMKLSDGSRVQLTGGNAANIEPSWSPDGTRIVFVRTAAQHGSSPEIYLINADGTGLKRLTHTAHTAEWSPAWQPLSAS